MRLFSALLLVVALITSAASGQRQSALRGGSGQPPPSATPVTSQSAVNPQYAQTGAIAVLRPGDVFTLRLGGMPPEFANEFALDYTVGSDGTVNIPMVGDMRAAGMTSTQFQQAVQNRLMADKIFTRPTVVISLQQNVRFVSVGGGVRSPGRQPWSSDLTLNSAVQSAGGLTDFGSPKGTKLIRDGKVQVFDLRQLERDPASDPKLLPGDQVNVRQ